MHFLVLEVVRVQCAELLNQIQYFSGFTICNIPCERHQYKLQIMTTMRFRENSYQSLPFENFIIVCPLSLQSLLNHFKHMLTLDAEK